MRRRAAYLGTTVVVLSVVLNLVHTSAHAGQHLMALPAWQLAYVTVVIYAAPVVAAILLWTRHRLTGAWLLAASMAASLVFGLIYHFVVPGPDNVFTQPPGTWRTTFQATAVLLAPLQVVGAALGLWATQAMPRPSAPAGRLAGPRRPGSEAQ